MDYTFSQLFQTCKNFILIGETGSGKSELALNIAVKLRREGTRQVHLFDLDQTKAMFRARDAEAAMAAEDIQVHYAPQLLDTPVMVGGVLPCLRSADSTCVLDVGGNENAARMAGCFSEPLNQEDTAAFYVLNPYRPWSGSLTAIRETMGTILRACGIQRIHLVANPNTGRETSLEDFRAGMERLNGMLGDDQLSGIFIQQELYERLTEKERLNCYPLRRYLTYPWLHE